MTPARVPRPIRAIIVDDSHAIRAALASIVTSARDVEVVLSTADPDEALRRAIQDRPDVVYLDLEMPRMDGFTFLRILMARRPTPVIVVSSSSRKQDVFKALELGALDFVAKPDGAPDLSAIRLELLSKIATVRSLRIENLEPHPAPPPPGPRPAARLGPRPSVPRVVVIGASTGGPSALARLLALLPADLAVPIAIAQHMPETFTRAFAERLDRSTPFEVREAEDGDLVAPGRVLLAPGGRHLKLVRTPVARGATLRALVVEPRPGDGRLRPSVDLLFESAVEACGADVCAVVLTGMGSDGRAGVSAVKRRGGTTLAESEQTAVVYGMPKEAVESGDVDEVLPLEALAERIVAFAERR
jgi:two-component system chemotaxis response regulator CheB